MIFLDHLMNTRILFAGIFLFAMGCKKEKSAAEENNSSLLPFLLRSETIELQPSGNTTIHTYYYDSNGRLMIDSVVSDTQISVRTINYSDSEIIDNNANQVLKTIYYIHNSPFADSALIIPSGERNYFTYDSDGKLIHSLLVLSPSASTISISFTYSNNNLESADYTLIGDTTFHYYESYIYNLNYLEMNRGFDPINQKNKNILSEIHIEEVGTSSSIIYNNQFDNEGRLIRRVKYNDNDSTISTFTYY